MDREARWATVHGVAKSRTRLSDRHFNQHSLPYLKIKGRGVGGAGWAGDN